MNDLPKTLAEAIKQKEEQRIGSNLTNLATAYTMLGEENERLQAHIDANNKLRAEIEAMSAMKPGKITLEAVKDLYERARAPRKLGVSF